MAGSHSHIVECSSSIAYHPNHLGPVQILSPTCEPHSVSLSCSHSHTDESSGPYLSESSRSSDHSVGAVVLAIVSGCTLYISC